MDTIIQYVIPIVISIIAVVFNGYQLFLSNKHFLFDKRLKLYLAYKNLLEHQNKVRSFLEDGPDKLLSHEMLIAELTNDRDLSSMCDGWTKDSILLEDEDHKNFLAMIEKFRLYGDESSFVYGKCGHLLCSYFNKYADLCFKVYQYRICMKDIECENEQLYVLNEAMSLNVVEKRQKLLHAELIQTYEDLCKISDSIYLSKLAKIISPIRRVDYENNTDSGQGN